MYACGFGSILSDIFIDLKKLIIFQLMLKKLFEPVDIAILVYFRFFAGCFLAIELINSIFLGDLHEYTAHTFHFSYHFFEWVQPWPYWGMVLHYFITIAAGFMVAFGFYYRYSSILLFLGYTSLFLMEQGEYTNHFYLYCLTSFWMIWLPLNRATSYDARKDPAIVQASAPAWMLYLLLFHISLAYFFAGIAKLNPDWLIGSPMNLFFAGMRHSHPLPFLFENEHLPLLVSYGGIFFDLLIVPLMLIRKTRKFGFVVAVLFHLSNVTMFGLATFPWFSMMMTSMFFHPSWPRRIRFFNKLLPPHDQMKTYYRKDIKQKVLFYLVGAYCVVHLLLPLRLWLYPGYTSWTEQAHQFAWRMMLRTKSGTVDFIVENQATGEKTQINLFDHLTPGQYRDMVGKPDHILQFAHYLRDACAAENEQVAVYASCVVGLNGRPRQEMIRPGTDLAREKRSLKHYEWILLLNN